MQTMIQAKRVIVLMMLSTVSLSAMETKQNSDPEPFACLIPTYVAKPGYEFLIYSPHVHINENNLPEGVKKIADHCFHAPAGMDRAFMQKIHPTVVEPGRTKQVYIYIIPTVL